MLTASTNFYITDYNSFWKIHCFNFFPYKSISDQNWPCHKTGQGQPRGISWTKLVVLEYYMLHTKFSRSSAFQFQRRRFLKVFTIYGHGGHLGHVTLTIWTCFRSPFQEGFTWNLASNGLVVIQEKKFKNIESEWPWSKVNEWPWPLIFTYVHVLI